jgi:hypothetical protein
MPFDFLLTQGCRWRSNLGLQLANAFGVFQFFIASVVAMV